MPHHTEAYTHTHTHKTEQKAKNRTNKCTYIHHCVRRVILEISYTETKSRVGKRFTLRVSICDAVTKKGENYADRRGGSTLGGKTWSFCLCYLQSQMMTFSCFQTDGLVKKNSFYIKVMFGIYISRHLQGVIQIMTFKNINIYFVIKFMTMKFSIKILCIMTKTNEIFKI